MRASWRGLGSLARRWLLSLMALMALTAWEQSWSWEVSSQAIILYGRRGCGIGLTGYGDMRYGVDISVYDLNRYESCCDFCLLGELAVKIFDVHVLDEGVPFAAGLAIILVPLAGHSDSESAGEVPDALIPEGLVELGVDSDIGGPHHLGHEGPDVLDGAGGLALEGLAVGEPVNVDGGVNGGLGQPLPFSLYHPQIQLINYLISPAQYTNVQAPLHGNPQNQQVRPPGRQLRPHLQQPHRQTHQRDPHPAHPRLLPHHLRRHHRHRRLLLLLRGLHPPPPASQQAPLGKQRPRLRQDPQRGSHRRLEQDPPDEGIAEDLRLLIRSFIIIPSQYCHAPHAEGPDEGPECPQHQAVESKLLVPRNALVKEPAVVVQSPHAHVAIPAVSHVLGAVAVAAAAEDPPPALLVALLRYSPQVYDPRVQELRQQVTHVQQNKHSHVYQQNPLFRHLLERPFPSPAAPYAELFLRMVHNHEQDHQEDEDYI